MTSLVAIRCTDGVVIGSDSSVSFGESVRTIEQLTDKKIEIVGNTSKIIIAGTGYVGHHQRFVEAVRNANALKEYANKSEVEVAKCLSRTGINDFSQSMPADHTRQIQYAAFVAYLSNAGTPCLCELSGMSGFQPEVKRSDDLWFSSSGSGQSITDPFLALFRSIFWESGPPDVLGGLFTAYWALSHACTVNPGGVNFPVRIAIYGKNKLGKIDAWMVDDNELLETKDLVASATDHFSKFREILLGRTGGSKPPEIGGATSKTSP